MVSSSRATTRRTCTAPSNLKITLQFYRDWLKGESYLRNDDTWKTYCAEHVTIITNCALNIPQNLKSYQEIWGDAEGSKLYELAREQFLAKVGQAKMDEVWGVHASDEDVTIREVATAMV